MLASMSIFDTLIRVILEQIMQESKQAAKQATQNRITLRKEKRNEKTRLQYKRRSLQATVQEVDSLEQANAEQNAESTVKKPGYGYVSYTKNTASFPAISRLIVTQDVKNTTRFWPICLHVI